MINIKIKNILSIVIFLIIFFFQTNDSVHAWYCSGSETTVYFCSTNGTGTTWEVSYVYFTNEPSRDVPNYSGRIWVSRDGTRSGCPSGTDQFNYFTIPNYKPSAGDEIWYSTTCMDPQDAVTPTAYNYCRMGEGIFYTEEIDISCRDINNNKYIGCWNLNANGRGNVGFAEQCPYHINNTSHCTRSGTGNAGNCGPSYCGGSGNCTYYRKTCTGTTCTHPGTRYSTRCGGNSISGTSMPTCSGSSAVASVTCAPPAPTVTASAVCNGTSPNIRVNYVPNSGSIGNRSYDLRWRESGTSTWREICSPPASGTGIDYTITSSTLKDSTSYQVQVREHTDAGYNGPTNFGSATVTTPNCTPNTYTISGTVYIDTNSSGAIDAGDTPYAGGNASLAISGASTGTTTANGSGVYQFTKTNGNYSITASVTGYNVISTNPRAVTVNNANVANVNFLIVSNAVPRYSISGYVFRDDNGDGIRNGAEPLTSGTIGITGQPNINAATGNFTTPLPGLLAGNYTVSLLNNLAAIRWQATYPTNIPPSFTVTLGSGCVSVGGGSSCSSGNMTNLAFGIRPIPPAQWTQGTGGDMRADSSLINQIPSTITDPYFSIANASATLQPGIAFGTGLNLGNNGTDNSLRANPQNRYVNVNYTRGVIRTSYAFIKDTLSKNGITVSPITNPISSVPSAGVHSYTGNVTFSNAGGFTFSGGNYIFLVDGDININSNITVPAGNTAFFIATGDINVAKNVTSVQGIFSADLSFNVNGDADPALNNPLEIQGNVIGNAGKGSPSGYTNDRDLDARNATTPSVTINYRPDFVLFAPEFIRYTNYTIKEVAPGSN